MIKFTDSEILEYILQNCHLEDVDGGYSGFYRFPIINAFNHSPNKDYNLKKLPPKEAIIREMSKKK